MAELISRAVPSMEMVRLVSSGTEAAMSAIRAGARRHRPRRHRQVRRLLPRPRRQPARQGGLGRRHLRRARQPGRAGGAGGADPHGAVQRPRRGATPARGAAGARSRRSSSSRWPATWAWCRPRRASSPGCASSAHASRRAADLRRGDHRLPRRLGRRPGAATACGPISRASARSSAAACRSAPTAARARSWSASRRSGGVYQAGTLSGNPLAVAAGLATLRALGAPGVYERLEALGARVERGRRRRRRRRAGVPVTVNRVGSMLTAFFTDGPVTDYASAKRADTARYARFFHAMLERRRLPRALAVRGRVRLARARRRATSTRPRAACRGAMAGCWRRDPADIAIDLIFSRDRVRKAASLELVVPCAG